MHKSAIWNMHICTTCWQQPKDVLLCSCITFKKKKRRKKKKSEVAVAVYIHSNYDQALEQAAQGSGGVTIPAGVQKTCRCGISGHGLVGIVVLGGRLDLMILEVFSNLNDSMILFFYITETWNDSLSRIIAFTWGIIGYNYIAYVVYERFIFMPASFQCQPDVGWWIFFFLALGSLRTSGFIFSHIIE